MTRFTRAKGSKASNERLPCEATPWHVMKQQLDTVQAKESSEKPKNAKELLKEKDDPYYWDTVVNKTEWATLDTDKPSKSVKKNNPGKVEKSSPKKSTLKKISLDNSVSLNDSNGDKSRKRKPEEVEKAAGETENVPKKKKKNKIANNGEENVENVPKKKKNKIVNNGEENVPKKKKNNLTNNKEENVSKKKKNKFAANSEENSIVDENKEEKKINNVKLSKRQKRNRKNKMQKDNSNQQDEVNTPITFNVEGNDWNSNIKFGSSDAKSKFKPKNNNNNNNNSKPENNNYPNNYNDKRFNQKVIKQRPAKIRDNLEHKRRKPEPAAQKVIINGMEVEIVLHDGFPVRKDDAERLKELRKKLVMNGIPKPEIDRAMKLERRKAEKALARIRKNVCFHCRKAGHNLSDCPELGREEAATGICFKCGSTEHTHFECKVNKKEEFRFATCFICREQGHIAKQCPDNPNGLYPKGGACSSCGDVTHLKKDCPTLIEQKQGARITLSTIADVDFVETIDGLDKSKKNQVQKESKKVVKF
ncbi:GATOR complex protein WDR24-like [Cotesia glomerata]|nr:GATOR complex protein WDR24-like [Cotesia glomerata]